MKQFIKIVSLIILICVHISCSEKTAEKQRQPKLVKYQQIGLSITSNNISYSGVSQQNLVIDLSFRTNGTITKLNVKLGQQVKKGELLATLDNVTSRLSYEQALNNKNAAKSSYNTAKSSLDRARTLYEKGSTSLSDFEQAKNAFSTANQNYESSKRAIGIQQEQINYGYIYAPQDGVIAAVLSEINENIATGQSIATLNAGDLMEIKLGIPESNINRIHKNDKVDVVFSAIPNQTFKGFVSEIAPAVSAEASTYPVRITLNESISAIKSGMAASVRFQENNIKAIQKSLIVPPQAVGEDYSGKFVFLIVEKDSTFSIKKQTVSIGKLVQNGFEIHSGINTGDRIAVAGLQTLLDGQKVRLQ
ncbi:RND-type efflux membrane fusion protein [Psychroflexus torquis ATCC 700755]|uniref:RND-type efflux membrane fusion protein n=1 Tax=Psychroflexus torquis (strain ATCC 700755 / CIP 106069 / ACAM 623) TaxID=313595 RepID=K4IIK0_PSYTT|nr:efflux RND transporter periplasmic adaptor subunit [Psychroflexus torquis]AFU70387.1 RND-type efflux membrane fusion protein [Psychroflexus torquis ATCC 700755]